MIPSSIETFTLEKEGSWISFTNLNRENTTRLAKFFQH